MYTNCAHSQNNHLYSSYVAISMYVVIFNSYTMGMSGLPDIYTRGLRVYISGEPRVHMV